MKLFTVLSLFALSLHGQTSCDSASKGDSTCAVSVQVTIQTNFYKDALIAWLDDSRVIGSLKADIAPDDTSVAITGIPAGVTISAGDVLLVDREPCPVVSVSAKGNSATVTVSRGPEALIPAGPHVAGVQIKLLNYPSVDARLIATVLYPALARTSQALGARGASYPGSDGVVR